MDSPYDVLLVDPDADEDEIDRAYRRRVMETHPDQGGSAREFLAVRAAYEAIKSDREGGVDDTALEPDARTREPDGRRSERDRYGRHEAGSGGGSEADHGDGTGSVNGGTGAARPGTDEDAGGDGEAGSEDTGATRRERAHVEYLNYEVLDDHGWDLDDEDLFEKAADAGLDPADYGRIAVDPDDLLLQGAEGCGFAWPYACRGGACANCAVAVTEGEVEMPAGHILPPEMVDRGIRLSCIGVPTTEELKVVYNVKHLPDLDELRLPARRFELAQSDD